MSKKDFKLKCSFHEYGRGKNKKNAIYFDYNFHGYKYMVKANIEDCKRNELLNILYDWIFNDIVPPWYVFYKYAPTDNERFKVSLIG